MPRSVIVLVAALAACRPFGANEAVGGDGDASPDSGVPASDASVDGGECAGFVEEFTTEQAWRTNGNAAVSGGRMVLVPASANRAGAAWRSIPEAPKRFRARFDFTISGAGTAADGMTFAWVDEANMPLLGGTGGGLGICGDEAPNGFAIALVSLGPNRRVAVWDTGSSCAELGEQRQETVGAHSIELMVEDMNVRILYDGATAGFETTLPRSLPARWIGLTAGTGAGTAEHAVERLSFEICP